VPVYTFSGRKISLILTDILTLKENSALDLKQFCLCNAVGVIFGKWEGWRLDEVGSG